ncbi:MAG TPA: 30S ribosomal protein S9 [Candidatus Pacearchaeota archaeon]|nr:MAG: 30S ribosomal protein S9 [Candidatus Pacearchaeota archaeon ex4484_31]HDI03170.1 30S ribosomal protein S9 [Candidatus Pacearchaeota archaeon]
MKNAIIATGKRKTSVARAVIKPGKGKIMINKKPISLFNEFHQLLLKEPLVLAQPILKDKLKQVDIEVNVRGGGVESQVGASRLAIAKALVEFFGSQQLKKAYLKYDKTLLVADVRRKEMRKWGISKARKKRQKSYR